MSDILIQCDNVGKKFCRDLKKSLWYGVKDSAADLLRLKGTQQSHELRAGEFWANEGVSFELKRGECLGLIGRNGAGKTTLLKMLNGLIKPDAGFISIRGQVGALIALGAGFNPVLTGRENILVNGSILGLAASQIAQRLDEIVEFSGLEEFLDTPVRNYSSGMQVRLGFAIAVILLQPDILLLDEVLAVGDIEFRSRCYIRVAELLSQSAVIFVSHSTPQISRICNRALLLQQGKVQFSGSVAGSIREYLGTLNHVISPQDLGSGEMTLDAFRIDEQDIADLRSLPIEVTAGDEKLFRLSICSRVWAKSLLVELHFADQSNEIVAQCGNAAYLHELGPVSPGTFDVVISMNGVYLNPGIYNLHITIRCAERPVHHYLWIMNVGKILVSGNNAGSASTQFKPRIDLIHPSKCNCPVTDEA